MTTPRYRRHLPGLNSRRVRHSRPPARLDRAPRDPAGEARRPCAQKAARGQRPSMAQQDCLASWLLAHRAR